MSRLPRSLSILLSAVIVLLAAYPFFGDVLFPNKHAFLMQKLTGIMIMAVMAMSLDLLVGVAGLVSMGHAAFFGLGGYMLAMLSPEYSAANLWVVLPAALVVVAIASAMVGYLSIRTSGIYFIMVTLAFGQMGFYFFNDSKVAGGSDGAYIMFKPAVEILGVSLLNLGDKRTLYYVGLGALVGVYLLLRLLLASPFGRVVSAIGVNENRVRGLGFDPVAYKLLAFTIGGTIAGLAGFLAAIQYGFVNPATLSWHHSGEALVMVILGGMGTLFGPAIGAFVFELAKMGFESVTEHWLLPMGMMIIGIVLLLPKGVGGLLLQLFSGRSKMEGGQ
ncbi:ABC-type branched-chain amino acid transport system protein [Paramagnetospirillum caucaseum]|uniref:ABC-type branched-chain amino acid transport system protein n=1 Tax=Paramagnetospirillum caucaseum TaxID=1244869 RepID=M2Z2G3_9PROT|nr:branched-chain amino acid ABC transporter permease [Paramagnetospirillum caucaseum]EME68505.1 ABC-type branched-chain amino acid transport system protein [Paramagnetospirillum caucaseum]